MGADADVRKISRFDSFVRDFESLTMAGGVKTRQRWVFSVRSTAAGWGIRRVLLVR